MVYRRQVIGLSKMYGEDILEKVKGCEFHFQQYVNNRAKSLGVDAEQFKTLSNILLKASTQESYFNAHNWNLSLVAILV